MTDRTPAMISALSVALKARTGTLTPEAVEAMTGIAQDVLPAGDPLRSCVTMFSATWKSARHDAAALERLGEDLHRCVLRTARPAPPDMERADIYG